MIIIIKLITFISCFNLALSIFPSPLDNLFNFFNLNNQNQNQNPYNLNMPVNKQKTFQVFKNVESKKYTNSQQQKYRMLVYKNNLQIVNNHNNKKSNINQSNYNVNVNTQFTMEVNKFADLTELQFRKLYTMTYPSTSAVKQKVQIILNSKSTTINQQNNIFGNSNTISNINDMFQFRSGNLNNIIMRDYSDFDNTTPQIADYQSQTQLDLQIKRQIQQIQNKKNIQSSQNVLVTNNQFYSSPNQNNKLNNNLKLFFSFNQKNLYPKSRFLQYYPPKRIENMQVANIINNNISIDWTKSSGTIRDQGKCGACYAFAAVDAVSATYSIYKYNNLFVPMSVQQIIDCTNNGLALGCNGGFLEGSFSQIQTQGVTTEFAYKYIGKKSDKCLQSTGQFKISSFRNITSSCSLIIEELKKKPLAIGIAGYRIRFYKQGVFDDCNQHVDHAVVLIGYKSGVGWKIKNSWGEDWGLKGYAWIKQGNKCGICSNAFSATIPEQSIFF